MALYKHERKGGGSVATQMFDDRAEIGAKTRSAMAGSTLQLASFQENSKNNGVC